MSTRTGKLTFQQARMQSAITSRQVADQAGVPLHKEYPMELGNAVPQQCAEQVLAAFSYLMSQVWTLGDLDIHLNEVLEVEQANTEPRHCSTK